MDAGCHQSRRAETRLDSEAGDSHDAGNDLVQRLADEPSKVVQLCDEFRASLSGIAAQAVDVRTCGDILKDIAEGEDVRRVLIPDCVEQFLGDLSIRAELVSHRVSPSVSTQRREVAHPEGPSMTGEESDERRVVGRIVQHAQHCHEVGDLGSVQQRGHTDHVVRDSSRIEGGCRDGDVGTLATEDGHLFGREIAEGLRNLLDDPPGLFLDGLESRDIEAPTVGDVCGRSKLLDLGVLVPQLRGDRVGHGQDLWGAATHFSQRAVTGWGAVGLREVLGELVDVEHARTAPAIDGLAGVAHSHDRMSLSEQ